MKENVQYLNTMQLAERLNLSVATLARWRYAGKGPEYVKFGGAVRYSSNAVGMFIQRGGIHG